jgi:hypothetical protein
VVESDAVQQFGLGLAVAVEELHEQQFLSRVQVHVAEHGGGMAVVGAGKLEDGVAEAAVARCAGGPGAGSVIASPQASWQVG